MKVEGINAFDSFASSQKTLTASEEVERNRKEPVFSEPSPDQVEKKQPAEEILSRIKEITEDGTYSIRFEKDQETEAMVVRLVDQETGEVKRQFPPEEILQLNERLDEWRGNIIDTES